LGQGGVNVSRRAEAEAVHCQSPAYKKPKILILDDSTSAVDTATDAKIREGFKKMIADTTTIIIAQRINPSKRQIG
jgi:ATP-binding cassette subfamily B protein